MIFTELVIENFGAYVGRQIINLRPSGSPLGHPENNDVVRPIVLLGGMNGGGKTTLMDAIRLALYGQRAKCSNRGNLGYSEFLKQSVNSHATSADITRIELSFEDVFEGNWQQFKIIRAWKRDIKDGKDSLSIEREDRFDRNLEEHWDEYIESILPLGISNLFLFDGEQVKELAELDTPPPAVVEAINNLLGLELAEKLSVDLSVLVNRKRKAIASKAQLLTIEEIETKLAAKKQDREQLNENYLIIDEKLKQAYKKRERATTKFNKQGGKIAAERDVFEARIQELNSQLENKRKDLIELAESSLPLGLIIPLLNNAIKQGELEVKSQQFKQAQKILAVRDRKLLDYFDTISLSPESIDKIEFFIEKENKTIADSIKDAGDNYLDITEKQLQQLYVFSGDRLSLETKNSQNIIQEIERLTTQIDNTETQLASAASPEDYQKLIDAVENTQKAISKYKTQYDIAKDKVENIDREIDRVTQELNRKLKNYSEEAIDKIGDEHIINSATKVQDTLKVFKEKLTLKKLNKLETEVKDCFLYLLHKSNLINRVTIDSDRFRLKLYDTNGQLFPKQRLSAGEKQLLAIAFLWGLARVSGRNLPIAIDTPLGRLDSSHRNNLVERYFPTASHQVILLSTDTEIGEKEVNSLRKQEAISQEYLLKYNPDKRQTTVEKGYFW
ncbi:DNA sulfur modification protein DndD [Waterburya agarophytonicola K14]|uniref:Nuclease SbcCD subunit C n=1 Tax=Waterburya agarophytonicola KI4 TaxID=2874699 RepID=A0A964BVZ8_9CYAN|nr:DNA sulfur modification protein DndD [Waterburya agarophytonicola]MCC0179422.1 DNA sulfur modification protein DndD [Waterburya agarophytonicola KI4]